MLEPGSAHMCGLAEMPGSVKMFRKLDGFVRQSGDVLDWLFFTSLERCSHQVIFATDLQACYNGFLPRYFQLPSLSSVMVCTLAGRSLCHSDVIVQYDPTQATKDRIATKNAANKRTYEDQQAEAKEKVFYDTLRNRLKLAGQVQPCAYEVLREEEGHVIYSHIIKRLYGDESGFQSQDYFAASEMILYFFDIDTLLCFVATDSWTPQSIALVDNDSKGCRVANTIGVQPLSQRAALTSTVGTKQAGNLGRDTYSMTEEKAPAPVGASLGWLLQVVGKTQRNAFLNSPWVKAMLPIRPGREENALKSLQRNKVAGSDGLDDVYSRIGSYGTSDFDGLTCQQIFLKIANTIKAKYDESMTPEKVGKERSIARSPAQCRRRWLCRLKWCLREVSTPCRTVLISKEALSRCLASGRRFYRLIKW